jgi:hypothetical protein
MFPETNMPLRPAVVPFTTAVSGPANEPLKRVLAGIEALFTVPPVVVTEIEPPAFHVYGEAVVPLPPTNVPVEKVSVAGIAKQQSTVLPLRETVMFPVTVPLTTPALVEMVPAM